MKDRFRYAAVVAFAIGLVASSSAAAQNAPEQNLPQLEPGREFRLAAGDVIQLRFFYNPELEDVVQLRPDGMISMPLIGELSLDGLTITEAREQIERMYAGIVRQPEVTIQVREYASQKIYVGGEVLRPGVVPLRGQLTVLDAIMEAGGHTRTGSNKTLILIRKGEDGQPVRQKLYLHGTDTEPAAASMPLNPFDVVLIPESRIARMDRWVDQYVRQLVPITLTAGFTYLATGSTVVIP